MSGVPIGRRALNLHISEEEHAELRAIARRESRTVTEIIREMIRTRIDRAQRFAWCAVHRCEDRCYLSPPEVRRG